MFVDLTKAYDTIDRARLWEVFLQDLGIHPDTIVSLQRMYSDLVVEIAAQCGSIPVRIGLKQGCPCSPVLFSIYFDRVAAALEEYVRS